MDDEKYTPPRFASQSPSICFARSRGASEAVGCMLRKSAKGHLVKLDADIFYQLLEYKLSVKHRRRASASIGFWEKGVHWSKKTPGILSRFIMKAKKGQIIDHINRNIFDNRRINLRIVNLRQNALNYTRRNPKTPFYGVYITRREKYNYWLVQYYTAGKKQITNGYKFSVLGLFLAAVAHDKMIIENNEEDYAPLNFQMFKIPEFKKVLLATDIKLLRSIYLGRKNKNSHLPSRADSGTAGKTAPLPRLASRDAEASEKTKPEKKNTVYKDQFFFDFRV